MLISKKTQLLTVALAASTHAAPTNLREFLQMLFGLNQAQSFPIVASRDLERRQVQTSWGQCGGSTNGNTPWPGPTACPASQFCSTQNQYYAQCTPGSSPATQTQSATLASGCTGTQTSWGQCGGSAGALPWACPTYPTACPTSQFCSTQNQYYAQCTPGSPPPTTTQPTYSVSQPPSTSGSLGCAVTQTSWGQCGGSAGTLPWACPTYPTACPTSQFCSTQNQYYAQCTPGPPLSTAIAPQSTSFGSGCTATQTSWGQCGGSIGALPWACPTYPTSCPTGQFCSTQNQYYAQCTPGITTQQHAATTSSATAVKTTTTQTTSPNTTTAMPSSSFTSQAQTSGIVKYGGVNIAGCDFGCGTDGTCPNTPSGGVTCPPDGINQMKHFVQDDGLNAFRIPTGWQFLVNGNLGGTLDATNFPVYDALVQGCISAGASLCIIDIHNYARWNGDVIGQSSGSVTDDQFVNLWQQLATHYSSQPQVAFGIMNEPHDLPSLTTWTQTVQKVVTAIRNSGATSQIILLESTDYQHIDGTSERALANVANPDGTYTNLVFDIHEYLDNDNSGQSAECDVNRISDYTDFTAWLMSNGRQALVTETGGGDNQNCITLMCQQLSYLNSNSAQYLGWIGWAAGSFAASVNPNNSPYYSETPAGSPGAYTDHALVAQCIAGKFNGRNGS